MHSRLIPLIICIGTLSYEVLSQKHGKSIVFAVGGLRHDYIQESGLKAFKIIIDDGVFVPVVHPVYPALMYPNLYSLATGLYAENHGMVGNIMYNQTTKEFFMPSMSQSEDEAQWWNEAEPIWTTAERHGLKTALYWWPGCQILINKTHASSCEAYREDMVTADHIKKHVKERLEDVIEMFKNDALNLAMFYYGLISVKGLEFGPKSIQMKQALLIFNDILQRTLKRIKEEKLQSQVNVIVASDSGIMEMNHSSIIHLDLQKYSKFIELQISYGSMSMLLPYPNTKLALLSELQNAKIQGLHVYQKEDIPPEYHIKNNHRILPILLQADPGYIIDPLPDPKAKSVDLSNCSGLQGYDSMKISDMHTSFLAIGPAFKKGIQVPQLSIVDLYNVLCHSIGLNPISNNGSISRVQPMITRYLPPSTLNGQTISCAPNFIIPLLTSMYFVFYHGL